MAEKNTETKSNPAGATPAQVITLPKMNIKLCGCEPRDVFVAKAQVFMVRIFGEATAAKTKLSRVNDAYTYLIGTFRAERPAKTEDELKRGPIVYYESETLYLPATIQEKLESQLTAGAGKVVQFGYDIYATPDSAVTTGYRYACKSIVETASSDRLAVMAAGLTALPLPGVKVETKATPEKAKAK